jgi:hypothetical protein
LRTGLLTAPMQWMTTYYPRLPAHNTARPLALTSVASLSNCVLKWRNSKVSVVVGTQVSGTASLEVRTRNLQICGDSCVAVNSIPLKFCGYTKIWRRSKHKASPIFKPFTPFEVRHQLHAPIALTKTEQARYTLARELGGLRSRPVRRCVNCLLLELDPAIQFIASQCTTNIGYHHNWELRFSSAPPGKWWTVTSNRPWHFFNLFS